MKYLIVFLFGFCSHKVANYAYDYSFEKQFMGPKCSEEYVKDTKDLKIDAPLTKRFECTHIEMGLVDKLKYILVRPSPLDDNKWTF